MSDWPPASTFASSRPSSSIASSSDPARSYSNPAGITPAALAAASTARTMLWYPVQRQRLPSRPTRISSSDGLGFSFSSETVAMTNPGVQ